MLESVGSAHRGDTYVYPSHQVDSTTVQNFAKNYENL